MLVEFDAIAILPTRNVGPHGSLSIKCAKEDFLSQNPQRALRRILLPVERECPTGKKHLPSKRGMKISCPSY